MNSDDKVEDYPERGPTANGDTELPDGAVHLRRVLGSSSVWSDPPPGALDGVLSQIHAERAATGPEADAPGEPAAAEGPAELRPRHRP